MAHYLGRLRTLSGRQLAHSAKPASWFHYLLQGLPAGDSSFPGRELTFTLSRDLPLDRQGIYPGYRQVPGTSPTLGGSPPCASVHFSCTSSPRRFCLGGTLPLDTVPIERGVNLFNRLSAVSSGQLLSAGVGTFVSPWILPVVLALRR